MPREDDFTERLGTVLEKADAREHTDSKRLILQMDFEFTEAPDLRTIADRPTLFGCHRRQSTGEPETTSPLTLEQLHLVYTRTHGKHLSKASSCRGGLGSIRTGCNLGELTLEASAKWFQMLLTHYDARHSTSIVMLKFTCSKQTIGQADMRTQLDSGDRMRMGRESKGSMLTR
jgi:hypothetical protein